MRKKVTCQKCGTEFLAKRSTAKFCSDSCRVGYHQSGDSIMMDLEKIEECLNRIIRTATDNPGLIKFGHTSLMANARMKLGSAEKRVLDAFYKPEISS